MCRWNGPQQTSETTEKKTNASNQKREQEMQTFLHKEEPKENGMETEYTVIPLDDLPDHYSQDWVWETNPMQTQLLIIRLFLKEYKIWTEEQNLTELFFWSEFFSGLYLAVKIVFCFSFFLFFNDAFQKV